MDNKDEEELARLIALSGIREASSSLLGAYASRFKGEGLEYAELEEYGDGCDSRGIQWPLSMRKGRLLVKKYEEERQKALVLGVDVSMSMRLLKGSFDTCLSAVSLLGGCAALCGDAAGMLLFGEEYEKEVPFGRGARQARRMLSRLLRAFPHKPGTALCAMLQRLCAYPAIGMNVVIISDLMDAGYGDALRRLACRHDVLVCQIEHDCGELAAGLEVSDAESGAIARLGMDFRKKTQAFMDASRDAVLSSGASHAILKGGEPALQPLLMYFRRRMRR